MSISQKNDWPFDDPPNVATISLRDIMEMKCPILFVSHDEDDGMWQFLDGRDAPQEKDAVVLCLEEVLSLDPTIRELADLPLGWRAWRDDIRQKWQREPIS
jgi:hypothetical protein